MTTQDNEQIMHAKQDQAEQAEKDEFWMMQALRLAQSARDSGEVPVGAILVKNDVQIAQAWNQPIQLNDPTAHAEILCLRHAAQNESNYRLTGCTLYVTLEPCAMCAGALVHARIARLVYAASEPKAGCVHSQLNLLEQDFLNHSIEVTSGVLAEESSTMLSDFFAARRQQIKQRKQQSKLEKKLAQIADKQVQIETPNNAPDTAMNNQAAAKIVDPQTRDSQVEEKPVLSPCVSVCALDSDDVCVGCYRTSQEITDWTSYDNDKKREVIRLANERCQAMWSS